MSLPLLSPSDLDRLEELARSAQVPPVKGETEWIENDVSPAMARLMFYGPEGDGLPGLILSLVAMARRAPRWIPVEEALPAPERDAVGVLRPIRVLVLVEMTHPSFQPVPPRLVEFGSIVGQEWDINEGRDAFRAGRVVAWMPLPEATR